MYLHQISQSGQYLKKKKKKTLKKYFFKEAKFNVNYSNALRPSCHSNGPKW